MLRSLRVSVFLLLMATFIPPPPGRADTASPAAPSILYGMRVGLLVHDVGGLWSNTRSEGGSDGNAEIVFRRPSRALWKGVLLPNAGVSINSRGDTSKAYAGVLWEFLSAKGLFFNLGVGLAVHDGRLETGDDKRKQLGSRLLFRVPIEFGFTFWGRHRLSVLFDHISNADLAEPNEGLDTVGVRYGYQF
jgi:lipid A 3-O-deacylase